MLCVCVTGQQHHRDQLRAPPSTIDVLEHFPPLVLLLAFSGHPALLLLLLPLSVPLLLRLPFLLFDQVEHHSVCRAAHWRHWNIILRSSLLSSLHLSHLEQSYMYMVDSTVYSLHTHTQ